ncbi:MAG: L-fucose:H+ symporter permease [Chitinophagaceae bacterium]|nr:L-fucose:H+ symporter permease [Chitinophagaceae bacterium]
MKAAFTEKKYLVTLIFVTSLFMIWGVAMTMGDVLNKHFQNVLHVSKSQSGLVQFSVFGAYAVMGIPAGLFMKKFGYQRGVQLGLFLFAVGAFLFIPAANAESFSFFRFSLFVLACGMATLETVAHPFVASLGPQATSDQRLNFAQAFNGVGTIIGPAVGGMFILSSTVASDLESVKQVYIIIGAIVIIVALAFSLLKIPAINSSYDPHQELSFDQKIVAAPKRLFQHKHFIWAIVAQFFNVAAQGGTWAFFINYGHEKMGLSDEKASYYFSLSMVLMMVGRFAGTFLMRYIRPNLLLSAFAVGNILMCIIVAQSAGWISFIALLMINFFFSIMFPTIFSLGLKDLGHHTQQASSFIVMGVVGGAVFPPLMGLIANKDVASAYYLPIICYAVILLYGLRLYKSR